VEVNGQRLEADQFLIATGVRAAVPDVPGLREAGYITNQQAVSLPQLPNRLAIIGAGQLGMEFAQLFSRFGVEVAVFESSDRIMAGDDAELVAELRQILEDEGIRIETDVTLSRVTASAGGKCLHFEDGATQTADEILLAAGRTPVLDSLNLAAAGVESHVKKGILVDNTLCTNVTHIWAGGDVATPYRFTHVAENHGEVIAHNMLSEKPKQFEPAAIPWATYTSPSLATVGKTEEELQKDGTDYRVLRKKFSDVPRALATGQTYGQVKLLVGSDDKVLGGHILADHAGDLLAPVILAMHCGLPVTTLASAIFAYPTMAEGVGQAAQNAG
jgi:pyruvate/2-oxoglutarate dehydrogenase complex dihydrolipoamide dehydrogenase (E3) component